ncbi:hypothetical protein ACFZDJ_18695 [Streptomyces sp. NPDC007896]|uniref:hypothetical protein n=1 Tax=unclassified Streptomyces TaxID=2593676 RepID=UPI0036E6BD4B
MHCEVGAGFVFRPKMNGIEAPHYQLDGPHRMVITSGAPRRMWPADYQYVIEIATRSGLFGPWTSPTWAPNWAPGPSRPTIHDHRDTRARCRRERCTR